MIYAVVCNLFFFDLLGPYFQGTKAEKLQEELQIVLNFFICAFLNVNGFIYTLTILAPMYLVAVLLQALAVCRISDVVEIQGEEIQCQDYSLPLLHRSLIILALIMVSHYAQQYMFSFMLFKNYKIQQ
jgi:hypothetical protein